MIAEDVSPMSITTDPTLVVAGTEVTLSSDVGDSHVFSLTSVPADSALAIGKIVDPQGNAVAVFTPDVPGEYGVTSYNYQELCPDPATGIILKLLGTTATTINAGGYADLPIVPVNGHKSTLRLTVVGDYVRAAELINPATTIARNAALDATVAAAVEALVDVTVAGLDSDLETNANDLRTNFEAHRQRVGSGPSYHLAVDWVDTMVAQASRSNQYAIGATQDAAFKIVGHLRKEAGGTQWHSEEDSENVLAVSPRCATLEQATVLSADLRERVYERHRILSSLTTPASHIGADALNALAAPGLLTTAIVAYLDYVVDNNPSAAAGEAEGLADASAKYGFRVGG